MSTNCIHCGRKDARNGPDLLCSHCREVAARIADLERQLAEAHKMLTGIGDDISDLPRRCHYVALEHGRIAAELAAANRRVETLSNQDEK